MASKISNIYTLILQLKKIKGLATVISPTSSRSKGYNIANHTMISLILYYNFFPKICCEIPYIRT